MNTSFSTAKVIDVDNEGRTASIADLANPVWRHRELLQVAALAKSAKEYKDLEKRETGSLSRKLMLIVQGVCEQYGLRELVAGSTDREHIRLCYKKGIALTAGGVPVDIVGAFETECYNVAKELEKTGKYDEKFFSAKGSNWANSISKIRKAADFGLNFLALNVETKYVFVTLSDLAAARTKIEEYEAQQRTAAGAVAAEQALLATPEGRKQKIAAGIGSIIAQALASFGDDEALLHFVEHNDFVTKLLNTVGSQNGGRFRDADRIKLRQAFEGLITLEQSALHDEAAKLANKQATAAMSAAMPVTIANEPVHNSDATCAVEDELQDAETAGYVVGSDGGSLTDCPHDDGDMRQRWLVGFKRGVTDRLNQEMA